MITLHSPEETLVVVPHIMGYLPSRHLVLCGLDQHGTDAAGKRACIGPMLAIDHRNGLGEEHARFVCETVRRHRVTKAVLVFYCEDLAMLDGWREALLMLHAAVAQAMEDDGSGLLATFAADGEKFTRVDGGQGQVRSLRELDSSEAAAALVYEGSAPLDEPPDVAVPPKAQSLREEAMRAAAEAEASPRTLEEELNVIDLLVSARVVTEGRHAQSRAFATGTRPEAKAAGKAAEKRAETAAEKATETAAEMPSAQHGCSTASDDAGHSRIDAPRLETGSARRAELPGATRDAASAAHDGAGREEDVTHRRGNETHDSNAAKDPGGAHLREGHELGEASRNSLAEGEPGGESGRESLPKLDNDAKGAPGSERHESPGNSERSPAVAGREGVSADGARQWARLCGLASHALTDTGVRDRLLLYGIDPHVQLPLLSLSADDVTEALAAATERAPDIDRLRSTCALLEEIASYGGPGEHAALAGAGYLHWWSCSNTVAAHRALSAVRIEPGYPLADLLLDVVNSGIMAPWYSKACPG